MSNINTWSIDSTIILNKIEALTSRLRNVSQARNNITKHDLIIEANNFLALLFKALDEPIFNPLKIIRDSKPDLPLFNHDMSALGADLQILFSELENLEKIMVGNFNFLVSEASRITSNIKGIYSNLGDYILYAKDPLKEVFYITDSFINLNRVDNNTALLNATQCNIDQDQGIVTLPVEKELQASILITEDPVINIGSNGTPGNNHELVAERHDDIKTITDNNADTWFEYERVVSKNSTDNTPLILDLIINIGDPQIVNFIRINPNNFGARTSIKIVSIDTSIDGHKYLSIKDDIPITGFETIDEENIFDLSSTGSKFSGQGVYTFNPRKIKYVHVVLRQDIPYTITSTTGATLLRYAIGIRDISIEGIRYASAGELISKQYNLNNDIKKVALVTHQTPIATSDLVGVEHFISIDNGTSWNEISPLNFEEIDGQKIINFNTVDLNTIDTSVAIKNIRYKVSMARDDDAFSNNTPVNKKLEAVSELHSVPLTTPFDLVLTKVPTGDSIRIIDPGLGSRGLDNTKLHIGVGTGTKKIITLPFARLPITYAKFFDQDLNGWSLSEFIPSEVWINGEKWFNINLSFGTSTSKIYELNTIDNTIAFGDDTNGMAPPIDATIEIRLKPERLYPAADTHIAQLDFMTSNNQEQSKLKYFEAIEATTEVLNKGRNIHHLKNKNLSNDHEITFSDTTVFAVNQGFINGATELLTPGNYSIDLLNGIVYSLSKTSSTQDTNIYYHFTPENIVNNINWALIENSQVQIYPNAYKTIDIDDETVPNGVRYFNLANLAVEKSTVSFAGTNVTSVFRLEVPFKNGRDELNNFIYTTENLAAITTPGGVEAISLRLKIVQDDGYATKFSNTTVFASQKTVLGDVVSAGDYYIDKANSIVYVYVSTLVSNPGTIEYYYQVNSLVSSGLYSINYKTGEVYTSTTTISGITASYQYTHYELSYPIARFVSPTHFTYDVANNTVTLKDIEILQRRDTIDAGRQDLGFYQVLFNSLIEERENISELKDFFSPILKDYALHIITGDKLLL